MTSVWRRRRLSVVLVWSTLLFADGWGAPFRFAEATIAGLQAQMAGGRLTSRELTAAYLERIAAIDRAGPRLNAVLEINPDALALAQACDDERRGGKVRGPLHGIPVLIKDNIGTADRMETTAGSLALIGARPARDAGVVAALRAAGAVILGKTNLSEWANFRSNRSTSGWSARGGLTRNPYAPDFNPSGSSSGSAVGVAANLCVVAIGTETDGSIVSPASVCGIVGLKPTVGAVSRAGIVPISISQDTAGPMARTVRDAALLFRAMIGAAPSGEGERVLPDDFLSRLDHAFDQPGLAGVRLGVIHGPFGFDPKLDVTLQAIVMRLRAAGAEVVEGIEFPHVGQINEAEEQVLQYEFKDGINRYLRSLGPAAHVRSLTELIAFDREHAPQEMPYFGQEIFERSERKGSLHDELYLSSLAANLQFARNDGIDALLKKYRLDALISLANGPAWKTDLAHGDRYTGGSSTPAAVAGYPSITVPATEVGGLPVGLLFTGTAWSEPTLLRIAAGFEQATHARRAPDLR